jgi:hypothetical protein
LVLDLIGGCTLAAFLLVFLWLTFVRSDGTASQVKELRRVVQTVRQDLGQAMATRDQLRGVLADRQEELAKTGQLPEQTPVDEYFQTLSRLAEKHHLRVVRQNPLPSRSYPGLFERRYAYEVSGAMPDLTRFFRAIEDTDYWADVSFFKIDNGRGRGSPNERGAVLIISLFSALPADDAADTG